MLQRSHYYFHYIHRGAQCAPSTHRGTHAGHFCYSAMPGEATLSSLLSTTYVVHKPLHRSVIHHDYPENPRSLGQKLKRTRIDLRLQIKQVAQATGVNECTIINWEYDRCMPRDRLLDTVREFYQSQGHSMTAQL